MTVQLPIVKIPNGKTVLVVDDWDQRIDWFKMRLEGTQVHATYVMTPSKAENVVGAHKFDIVFLDHDAIPEMTDSFHPDTHKLTFYRVAQILARQAYDGVVVIHSWNPVGAENMKKLLQERTEAYVMVQPFGKFELEVV